MGQTSESNMVSLWVFILILNIVFPVLGYTFTSFGEMQERYELDLNPDSLMIIGLNLVGGESKTLTFKAAGWEEYDFLNISLRARWARHRISGLTFRDGIRFQRRGVIDQAFDIWLSPYTVNVKSVASNEWFVVLRNETIVRDFDQELNWSRFVLLDGHNIFITPFTTDGNITKAVYQDGVLNVTVAKSFDEEDTRFNFWRFIGWYFSLLIGDQSWGLPSIFSWVIRILAALSAFAAIMLARRMIPL